jgi:hypothetical protein
LFQQWTLQVADDEVGGLEQRSEVLQERPVWAIRFPAFEAKVTQER